MSLGKVKGIRQCSQCGASIEIYHKHRMKFKNVFCSRECQSIFNKSKDMNTECSNCGKWYHVKPYHRDKYKTHCCSKECLLEFKSKLMSGEGNHQYGLKGELNSSWKSNERITEYGYKMIRCLDHPFRDSQGFVWEHRIVAEKYLLTENNSVEVDGNRYLMPELHVHHIDENKLNNNVDNLIVMTKSEHMRLHSKKKNQPRDKKSGRFVKN